MSVSERLLANGVTKAPTSVLDLFLLRDFLSTDECRELIGRIDARRKPSPLFGDNPDPEFRTSETCVFARDDALVLGIEARITDLLGLDPEHGEALQGQRYATGQQFKPHHDYLRTDQPYWLRQKEVGGQRTWTAMAYLNAPESGGETAFPKARLAIPPRQGTLLAWNNLDETGVPNPGTLHQGTPVTGGEKYIVTKWYRENRWGPPQSE